MAAQPAHPLSGVSDSSGESLADRIGTTTTQNHLPIRYTTPTRRTAFSYVIGFASVRTASRATVCSRSRLRSSVGIKNAIHSHHSFSLIALSVVVRRRRERIGTVTTSGWATSPVATVIGHASTALDAGVETACSPQPKCESFERAQRALTSCTSPSTTAVVPAR